MKQDLAPWYHVMDTLQTYCELGKFITVYEHISNTLVLYFSKYGYEIYLKNTHIYISMQLKVFTYLLTPGVNETLKVKCAFSETAKYGFQGESYFIIYNTSILSDPQTDLECFHAEMSGVLSQRCDHQFKPSVRHPSSDVCQ